MKFIDLLTVAAICLRCSILIKCFTRHHAPIFIIKTWYYCFIILISVHFVLFISLFIYDAIIYVRCPILSIMVWQCRRKLLTKYSANISGWLYIRNVRRRGNSIRESVDSVFVVSKDVVTRQGVTSLRRTYANVNDA